MAIDHHAATALKLVPVGGQPSVVWLREAIAQALDKAAADARAHQLAEQFPELSSARAEMLADIDKRRHELETTTGERKAGLDARELALRGREAAAAQRERATDAADHRLAEREAQLKDLLRAFDAYAAWLEGGGEVDDNGRLFNALRAECEKFKKGRAN